jgi:alpha-galactosidase
MELLSRFTEEPPLGFPGSFLYGGKSQVLIGWRMSRETVEPSRGYEAENMIFEQPGGGLRITCTFTRFSDFPALEWVVALENAGSSETGIIEDLQALDLVFPRPRAEGAPFVLHRTGGAPSAQRDFEVEALPLEEGQVRYLSGSRGRPSERDMPFFRVETADGIAAFAVGWSGQWRASLEMIRRNRLRLKVGLEKTRFRLYPGERVRTPRILMLLGNGDPAGFHSQFRRLMRTHYLDSFRGARSKPFLYCNTCFTRGGTWLNDCNEANQLSLIRALAPLGAQAVVTDAGWFEGGWPYGVGNWQVDKAKYPRGMAPLASEAQERGMIYGLWIEPERAAPGTRLTVDHPEWVLWPKEKGRPIFQDHGLLNFGLPEVQEYFFGMVARFMENPGFCVYRQDSNLGPLTHWRDNDSEERQGITEMKYVQGMYAFWDRLKAVYPDCLMIECAGGGRRIDLETVMRFHIHQKSDHWFDSVADQGSNYGLSQFLPNSLFMTPIRALDNYSFHSALPSSLCMGWPLDDKDFPLKRAEELTKNYLGVRHVLNCDWYPLTPYNRDPNRWLAFQFNDPERGEGIVLAYRREESPESSLRVGLRGLDREKTYRITGDNGDDSEISGATLMEAYDLFINDAPGSLLLRYRRLER